MAQALIDRPVRMPRIPEASTPWYHNPGAINRLCLETVTPTGPDVFLLEDSADQDHGRLTLEY